MAIRVTCECGKTLVTSDASAGKKGRCPACRKILVIPEAEESYPVVEEPREDALGEAAEEGIVARGAMAPPVVVEREEVGVGMAGGVGAVRQYLYFVLLLALLPLVVSILNPDREDLKQRIKQTFSTNKAVLERLKDRQDLTMNELLNALPEHRIQGAMLARDTWAHWGLAAGSAVVFLGLLVALFPGAIGISRGMALVGLFTGTLGIIFLIVVQYVADWTQGYWVTGRGIIVLLFYIVKFVGFSYRAALGDTNFFLSFLGFTCGVGLCEELCKALPVLWKHGKSGLGSWRVAMLWGLASGIGFGVSEGITYSSDYYNGMQTGQIYLVRFVSCVGLHAIWAGSVAISLFNYRDKLESDNYFGVVLQAILLPMLLHGLYDTLLKKHMEIWALATAVASFGLLAWQIEVAKRRYPEEELVGEAEGA